MFDLFDYDGVCVVLVFDVVLCFFYGDKLCVQVGVCKMLVLIGVLCGIGYVMGKLFLEVGWWIIICFCQLFDGVCCFWDLGFDNYVEVDLSDYCVLLWVIVEVCEWFGGGLLYVLINNVGILLKVGDGLWLNLMIILVEIWMSVFYVNLLVLVLFVQGLVDELKWGVGFIVNVMLIVGLWVYLFEGMVYVILKVVFVCLICEMVYDYVLFGICVNVIVFGEIKIDILLLEIEVQFVLIILLYCVGMLDEVVKVIFFFCLDVVSYVMGVEVLINGGQYV